MSEVMSLKVGEGDGMMRFRVLRSWWDRLRGLLGTHEDAMPVVLVGCSSIHTIGMSYPIDVALADRYGSVVKVRRALEPGSVFGCQDARYAFERPASPDPWLERGGTIHPRQGQAGPDCFAYEGGGW